MRSTHTLSALCAALVLGCSAETTTTPSEPALAAGGGPGQSVTGHAEVPVIGIVEKYSVNAIRRPDGTVSGEWQVKDKFGPGANFTIHGDVTCFSIQPDGKTAFIGGIVERNPFGIPAGSEAVWTIVDNGEGGAAPADLATDLTFGFAPGSGVAAFHCATGLGFTNIPPTPILRGNLQVRP